MYLSLYTYLIIDIYNLYIYIFNIYIYTVHSLKEHSLHVTVMITIRSNIQSCEWHSTIMFTSNWPNLNLQEGGKTGKQSISTSEILSHRWSVPFCGKVPVCCILNYHNPLIIPQFAFENDHGNRNI